ncbi:MAG: ribosome silencing factor [Candidatus Deferrimicrobiota bacterium]
MTTRDILLRCAGLAREKKGFDILALDVREHAGFTDYFLICSGSSDRQIQALSRHIAETLKKEQGVKALGTEGLREGRWVLLDYGDFVVHVFQDSVREFYNFDQLWGAAPEVPVPQE